MKKTNEQLVDDVKNAFEETVDGLDAATLSRLNRGRQAALAEIAQPGYRWSAWLPATGVAATVLIAVFMLQSPANMEVTEVPASDLDILLSEENIEMFEDLEFYSWLDTQDLEGNDDLG